MQIFCRITAREFMMNKREHATAEEMRGEAHVAELVKNEQWRSLKELADGGENTFATEAIKQHEASVAKNTTVNLKKSKKRHSKL